MARMIKAWPLLPIFCPLVLSACQRYSPAPLNLGAYRAIVESRDPSAINVVEYTKRLAASGDAPFAYDPSDGLSLQEAEIVALFFNPELRLARLRAEVPRIGAAEAGRWEDPQLGIDAERIIQSVEEPWVLGGLLSFTIPLSGRLGVEREKARTEANAAELRALAEERRVLAELRLDWGNWSATTERISLTRQILADLDAVVENAERLRQAGELAPVDARLLRIERVNQTGKLQNYEAKAREAEFRLKSRLGLVPTANVKLLPAISIPPLRSAGADVAVLIAEHPRVRLAKAEYDIAERTLKLEVQKQYPDLKIGGGYGIDEGDDRVLFGAGLPLPVFNANRQAIVEARASREVARAAAEVEYELLLAEASAAQARLEAAYEHLAYVEKELAPLADQQVNDARRLGKLGEFNALVLLEAIKTAHEAKLEILESRLNVNLSVHRHDALLESGKSSAVAEQAHKDQQR
jgi:outer membrane protein, heavy metal efflux system